MLRYVASPVCCILTDFITGWVVIAWFIIVSILALVRLDKIIKLLEKK
jgi:uncharacterized membrane protein YciS (DUF1049 family)